MRVVIDLETTSTVDLRKTGAQAYAEHPDTRVTVLCFALDDAPVYTWHWHDQKLTPKVADMFRYWLEQDAVIVAHNYLFEFNLWHHKLVPQGFPAIPLDHWSCTMARSLVAGYPASLDAVARAAKLPFTKDAAAHGLMLRMARPRTVTPAVTWWHETSAEHYRRLCDYCVQDVEVERALDKVVPELSARERAIFDTDHAINQRGLHVDLDLVDRLYDHAEAAKVLANQSLIRVTNGQVTTANQVSRLRAWLANMNLDLPDLRRGTVQRVLAQRVDPVVGPARDVLQARLDTSRSSTAKLDAIRSARSWDDRVKGTFQYYGAGRTGRTAGRRLQPQNLFRGSVKDVTGALLVIKSGCATEDLGLLFEDSPMGVVASCLRSCITAPAGFKLVVCDFAQIEARVLAWLAGETYALDCFARGDDIYTETARGIGSASRQLGKILVLACGFGMGYGRFQETAAGFGLTLTSDEAEHAVRSWRELNTRIVDFWWDCDRALRRVTQSMPGTEIIVGRVVFKRRPTSLLIRLPSGRHLVYRRPHILRNPDTDKDEFTYMGSHGSDWVMQRSWPGKIVENITQAVARDALMDKMVALHDMGLTLVAQVHDELIAEAPEAEADAVYATMKAVMSDPVPWGMTLPLAAEGFVAQRYQKK